MGKPKGKKLSKKDYEDLKSSHICPKNSEYFSKSAWCMGCLFIGHVTALEAELGELKAALTERMPAIKVMLGEENLTRIIEALK